MTQLTVSSVVPATIETGKVLITAATRATKGKTIEPANRLRCVVVPELVINVHKQFDGFLNHQLSLMRKATLAEWWQENGNAATTIDSELFEVPALLAFAARNAESQRLTSESVEESLTDFLETVNEKRRADALVILRSMAAANGKKGNEKECFALADKLGKWCEENDTDASSIPNRVKRLLTERAIELRTQRLAFETEDNATF